MWIVLISVLIAIVVCIMCMALDVEANAGIACGFVTFIFCLFVLNIIKYSHNNLIQNCKEESKLISPTISYANDSSFKILKYNHENLKIKIRIQKSDSLYHLNDSNYLIEPCEQIILKRSR